MKTPRERRCVATGEVKPEGALLRVALGPGDEIVPDLAARLPGRGGWISANRECVDKAVRKGLFARAFERKVNAPDDLADRFEALLEARALSLLGLARRAGRLAMGYDAAKIALKGATRPAFRIEALDGAEDGRAKLDRIAEAVHPGLPVAGCFTADALGAALGRERTVHAVLADGSEARGLAQALDKLAGFRAIDPRGAPSGAQNG